MKTTITLRMLARLALLPASFWFAGAVHAASFNCHLARHPTEQTICAVPELSKLDDQLAIAWSLAPQRVDRSHGDSGLNELKSYQRGWRTQRDACGQDVDCLRTSYLRRLQQLSQTNPDIVRDINDFHWSQTWTLLEISSKPLPRNRGGIIMILVNPYADAARLTFNASSWNGENSGREYKADAVVRADGKAFHVGADGCQLDFAIHGAQMEVEQRGRCGSVLGHGSDVDFQGTYIDEEHAPNKGFEFE
ncbi:lysozyme inhibitor LprI family protein [Burkholderia sp. LMG 32019]|uniref:lysozyme inhibitor LprI family protein n=1 Tax=Burkholderia sp. LMG 32019 TaxID=3158173 RepID=UPI003C2AF922